LDWLIAPGILDGSADQPRLDSTVASTRRFTAASHPGWAPRRLTNAAITNPHDVIDGALRLVVGLARTAVAGADGASVSLRRGGQLSTVAASDQTVLDMDADQYGTGEGPCVDASVVGRSFYAESLATETRWSSFTPRAQALGIQAILSSPLIVSERPIGALNMYSRTTNGFSDEDQRLASIFASQASAILAETDTDVTAERLAWRLSEALRSRQTIALAQGIIMERMGVGDERAYTELRRFSLRHQWSLRQQAEDIVASSQGTGSAERPASDDDTRD
jgi:GAF domain-containing protein